MADNPGEIPGYGAIPGPLARGMAISRDWVRWTVDPGTRQVIDRSADTYRPSAPMRAFIAARDRVCGFSDPDGHAWYFATVKRIVPLSEIKPPA